MSYVNGENPSSRKDPGQTCSNSSDLVTNHPAFRRSDARTSCSLGALKESARCPWKTGARMRRA